MTDPFRIPQAIEGRLSDRIPGFRDEYVVDMNLENTPLTHRDTDERHFSKTLHVILLGVACAFLFFEMRLIYLQLVKGKRYHELAEINRLRVTRVYPARGTLFDVNKNPLAESEPSFNLITQKAKGGKVPAFDDQAITNISHYINIQPEQLKDNISLQPLEGDDTLTIAEGISREQAVAFELYAQEFPDVTLVTIPKRAYVLGGSSAHLLGYMGKINTDEWLEIRNEDKDYSSIDSIGKSGIEKQYESELRGTVGRLYVERDVVGKPLDTIIEKQQLQGADIILTIESGLQKTLYEALIKLAPQFPRAAAVALDPRNGAIRALVSMPSFDNNIFNNPAKEQDEIERLFKNPDKPLFNRAVSAQYPSGSIIKPLVALAGLEEGIITKTTQFNSTGGIKISQWFFPDWKGGGHGPTNVIKALAESVNTFFYIVGGGYEDEQGLGMDRLSSYLRRFGLGATVGIDIPGEAPGFIPTSAWKESVKGEQWYIGDTYHAAIGQGDILVTPLQVASYTGALANRGTLWRPYLVERIIDTGKNSTVVNEAKSVMTYDVSKTHIDTVREGMRAAVTWGSATALNQLPIAVAGKTGTAQVGGEENPHAWFTGFAPYENPELVITIVVENAGEGSRVAVPIAYQAFLWYAQNRLH